MKYYKIWLRKPDENGKTTKIIKAEDIFAAAEQTKLLAANRCPINEVIDPAVIAEFENGTLPD